MQSKEAKQRGALVRWEVRLEYLRHAQKDPAQVSRADIQLFTKSSVVHDLQKYLDLKISQAKIEISRLNKILKPKTFTPTVED